MRLARTPDGTRAVAARGINAVCPCCEQSVIAKCGVIKSHHWAHRVDDCDLWSEPESEWHITWKAIVPIEQQEVVMERLGERHRADLTVEGGVLELQASAISVEDIVARESFYGNMAWLFRCTWLKALQFGRHGFWWKHGSLVQTKITKPLFWHIPKAAFRAKRQWVLDENRRTHYMCGGGPLPPPFAPEVPEESDRVWAVSVGEVSGPTRFVGGNYSSSARVVGKVLRDMSVSEFVTLLTNNQQRSSPYVERILELQSTSTHVRRESVRFAP